MKPATPTASPVATHFVFVDFENVPVADLSAIQGQPVHVTLFLGKNQKKLDLELVKQIKQFTAQIDLVEVGASGRNALDLTLACYLGRSIERSPTATFALISKDKDFAPMVAHLGAHLVDIACYESFGEMPFLPPTTSGASARSSVSREAGLTKTGHPLKTRGKDRSTNLLKRLKDPANRNRPSDEPALLAYIKTGLGKEFSEPKRRDIVRQLKTDGALTLDASNGEVSYSTPSF